MKKKLSTIALILCFITLTSCSSKDVGLNRSHISGAVERNGNSVTLYLKNNKSRSSHLIGLRDLERRSDITLSISEISNLKLHLSESLIHGEMNKKDLELFFLILSTQLQKFSDIEIILFPDDFKIFEVKIDAESNRRRIQLPFPANLSRQDSIEYLSTIIHELNHINISIDSNFSEREAAWRFREEYYSHKQSLCYTYIAINNYKKTKNFYFQIEPDFEFIPASLSTMALQSSYSQSEYRSFHAKAIVIENINHLGTVYCRSLFNNNIRARTYFDSLFHESNYLN